MWPFTRRTEARASIENPRVPLSAANIVEFLYGEAADKLVERVNRDTALQVPAVLAAITFLSRTIAALPLHHFRKTARADEVERVEGSPVGRVLHDAANAFTTAFAWRVWAVQEYLLEGRSLTYIERNRAGRVANLWPLETAKSEVRQRVLGRGETVREYIYKPEGRERIVYAADEIIDLAPMPSANGLGAVSPIMAGRRAIALSLAMESYGSRFFAGGGVPPMQLTGPIQSPAGAARAATDIAGALKRGRDEGKNVLVLPDGHELKPLGFDPAKGQLVEARRFQLEEIARLFNMPPTFLQDLTHGTFTNTEQQDLHFVKHVLVHHCEMWEQELKLKLFRSPATSNEYVEHNLDGLLRGDFKTRMEGIARAVQNAILTPNEARALDNRKALPNGDELLVQGATVPLGKQPGVGDAGDGTTNNDDGGEGG